MAKGWLIEEYTGDPFKGKQVTFGTTSLSGSAATITVGGKIHTALALGATDNVDVRCTSSAAQINGGTAKFIADTSSGKIFYFIVHDSK